MWTRHSDFIQLFVVSHPPHDDTKTRFSTNVHEHCRFSNPPGNEGSPYGSVRFINDKKKHLRCNAPPPPMTNVFVKNGSVREVLSH
jgi:hypothetical protein